MLQMKKYLIAMTVLMTLGMGAQTVTAQAQPPQEQEELVDSAARQGDALEAYSDTTQVGDTTTTVTGQTTSRSHSYTFNVNGSSVFKDLLDEFGLESMMGMTFVLMVLLIIFVFSPVLILGVLLYFIYKNRKEKMRLAEMAMKQGQPIPDQLLVEHKETDEDLWQKGLRQTFLGVGLLAFFGYIDSTLGIGIGILVTVIGLGKLAIVKTGKGK